MALLTTGTFATVTFRQTSASQWAALSPTLRPDIGLGLITPVVDGTSLQIYVVDDATGSFAFEGGSAVSWDDTLLASSVTAGHSTQSITDGAGKTIVWCQDAAGNVFSYDSSEGFLRSYSVAAAGDLKAFLP